MKRVNLVGLVAVATIMPGPSQGYTMPPAPVHQAAMPFTGLAVYDDPDSIAEDISELLLLLSPTATPFLNAIAQAQKSATDVTHKWHSERLGPDRIYVSTAFNSATANTGVQVNGLGHLLTVGQLLETEPSAGNSELVQVVSIPGPNSLLLSRNFATTGVNSLAVGGSMFVVATAALEGADTDGDVSRPRTEYTNFTQIFKKPIKISGTREAVLTRPNVGSEQAHQERLRTLELLRDLEKAILRGKSTNTIGGDDVYRTMNGLKYLLTTNSSMSFTHSSFAADPIGWVNEFMQLAWNRGARDLDILVCGADWSKAISGSNAARLQLQQSDRTRQAVVETITTDFGTMTKIMTPWLAPKHVMGLSSSRIFAVPLQGRAFNRKVLASIGDYEMLHILGEYTTEVHGEDLMFQIGTAL